MTPAEAQAILDFHRCTTPAYGYPGAPGGHCAACCYGTGFTGIHSQEDEDAVAAALAVLRVDGSVP